MFVYIILAFLAAIFAYMESGTRDRRDIKLLYIILTVFLFIVGLRYRHGDYQSYEMGFNNDIDVGDDAGYYAIQLFFHHIGFSFPLFVFLITLVSVYAFYKAFSISRWPLFGMVMILGKIFTLYAMSGIRQYIAIAICWWALAELLLHRRRVFFLVAVWVAYTMHGSAIIFFPVILLTKLKFTYRNAILILGAAMIIGSFSSSFFSSVAESSELINDRFGGYLAQAGEAGAGMNLMNYAENFLFLILALLVRKRAVKNVPFYDVFLYMFVIYCGFLIVGNEIGVVKRLRDFYAITYAILVPSYIYLFRGNSSRMIFKLIAIGYFIMLMFRSLIVYDSAFLDTNYNKMIPYHSILQKPD